jgi:hypothetical protein
MYLRGSRLLSWRVKVRTRSDQRARTGSVTFMFVFLGGFRPRFVEASWDEEPFVGA